MYQSNTPENKTVKFPAFAVVHVGNSVLLAQRVNQEKELEAIRATAKHMPGAEVNTVSVAEIDLRLADAFNAGYFMQQLLHKLREEPDSVPIMVKAPKVRVDPGTLVGKSVEFAGANELVEVVMLNSKGEHIATHLSKASIDPLDVFKAPRFPKSLDNMPKPLPEGFFGGLTFQVSDCGNPNCHRHKRTEDGLPFEAAKQLMPLGCFFVAETIKGARRATGIYTTPFPDRYAAQEYVRRKLVLKNLKKTFTILKGTGNF